MSDLAKREEGGLVFSDEQQKIIRDSFLSGASTSEAAMLLEVSRAMRLNPIKRQIFFVKRYDSQKRTEVWAFQVSIDGLRAIAERTGQYDGQDEPEFEEGNGVPKLCKVRVWRKGISRPFVGVAHWDEYVQKTREGKTTHMWEKFKHVMLAKCAEALALRKAFPEEMAGAYVPEEMAQDKDAEKPVAPTKGAEAVRAALSVVKPSEATVEAKALPESTTVEVPKEPRKPAAVTTPHHEWTTAKLSGRLDSLHKWKERAAPGNEHRLAVDLELSVIEKELERRMKADAESPPTEADAVDAGLVGEEVAP